MIDIPNLIRETGDKVEIRKQEQQRIVFLIEKADGRAVTRSELQAGGEMEYARDFF